jgi:hypothetical protein
MDLVIVSLVVVILIVAGIGLYIVVTKKPVPVATPTGTSNSTAVYDILKHTPLKDTMSGDVRSIKFHNVDCGQDGALGQVIYNQDSTDQTQGQFMFACNRIDNLAVPDARATSLASSYGGKTTALYLHDVDCGAGSLLSEFSMISTPENDDIQMRYQCRQSKVPLACSAYSTEFEPVTDVNSLQQHPIRCPHGKSLSRVKMVASKGNMARFDYTCCS